jgi:hypothetical protein
MLFTSLDLPERIYEGVKLHYYLLVSTGTAFIKTIRFTRIFVSMLNLFWLILVVPGFFSKLSRDLVLRIPSINISVAMHRCKATRYYSVTK